MRAVSFVSYFCRGSSRAQSDLDAANFIKAAKGHSAAGSLSRLDTKNGLEAAEWFGEIGALVLAMKRLRLPIILIPIPDSCCTLANGWLPRTALLAECLARHSANTIVVDALRWRKVVSPSHKGGTREPARLYANLTLSATIPNGTSVVVDDVLTTGGHIRAAAAKISVCSHYPCAHAICLGRSVPHQEDKRFAIVETELPDFYPRLRHPDGGAAWTQIPVKLPIPPSLWPTAHMDQEKSGEVMGKTKARPDTRRPASNQRQALPPNRRGKVA